MKVPLIIGQAGDKALLRSVLMGEHPKTNYEMIDAMGGVNSMYYDNFKKYCGIAYNCLRRHASIFYVLLLSILNFY